MKRTLYWYPKCGTCRNAKKWLESNDLAFEEVHIAEAPPSKEELRQIHQVSGLDLMKFFNTSGKVYRDLGLKDRIKDMDEDEMLELLASDGMLIKRPIVTDGQKATIGFKQEQFEETWL